MSTLLLHFFFRFIESTWLKASRYFAGFVSVDKMIKCGRVCDEKEKNKAARGLPQRIKVDNGPEFISRVPDAWAYFKLDYSRPGTPRDNPDRSSPVFLTLLSLRVILSVNVYPINPQMDQLG